MPDLGQSGATDKELEHRVQALRERLARSEWIVCAEALRILDGKDRLPGYVGFDDRRRP